MSYQQEFLRDHAVKSVWSHPRQDRHYIIAPKRLTVGSGSIRNITILYDTIDLPDAYSRWHVYQVAGMNPEFFRLFAKTLSWVSFKDVANINRLQVNLYNKDGVELPRSTSYYRYTESGAIIFCVCIDQRVPVNFQTDDIFLRTYHSAYWSLPDTTIDSTFKVGGQRFESSAEIAAFFTQMQTDASAVETYQVAYYHNGVRREVITAGQMAVGDTAEYVIDTSIKRIIKLNLTDLQVFDSRLDKKRKYLLNYPGAGDNIVDYYDDCDFFVTTTKNNGAKLFFHNNAPDSIRQLTHKDYSLTAPYVQRHFDKLMATYGAVNTNTQVEIVVRRGGYYKPLVKEASMIHELYKLSPNQVLNAMVGIDATIPFWQAATLEESPYMGVMRAPTICAVTTQLVQQAYGYHASATAIGDNFQKIDSSSGSAQVPFLYQFGCTVYEYDMDGVMLGYHHHYVGQIYTAKEFGTKFVEFLGGYGGVSMDEYNNARSVPVPDSVSYRVYLRRSIAGVVQPGFTDVTDNTSLYKVENGVFTWLSASSTDYPVLVTDRNFFAADYEYSLSTGRAQINIQTVQRHGNETGLKPIVIPQGEVEVFVAGRALIQGLEFFYEAGVVYITACYNLDRTNDVQRVHVRMRGACNKDGSMRPLGDIGFIAHDLLSANKRFDLRDGRVVRIIIAGQTVMRDNLEFSENSQNVAVTGNLNGYPYQIKDAYVPVQSATRKSTYAMIDEDAVRAKQVSDYLTKMIPEPDRGPVVAQKIGFAVTSSFFSQIINDLRYSRLILPNKQSFTRQEVLELCKSYEYLLKVDPLGTQIDHTWLAILPHPYLNSVGLGAREYQFLNQAVDIYAKGKMDIRTAVHIQA